MRSWIVNNEQQEENGWVPRPVADLRSVPLGELILDKDGAAADVRQRILDNEERLPFAGFNAFI